MEKEAMDMITIIQVGIIYYLLFIILILNLIIILSEGDPQLGFSFHWIKQCKKKTFTPNKRLDYNLSGEILQLDLDDCFILLFH